MKLKTNKMIKTILATFVFAMLVPSAMVAAGDGNSSNTNTQSSSSSACASNFVFPSWYEGLCDSKGNIKPPFEANQGSTEADTKAGLSGWITRLALNIVQIILYIVGYVSIGFIIYGGFMYMTQGDNSSGTVAARKTIQNAVIGLAISIMSVAIVKFVTGII